MKERRLPDECDWEARNAGTIRLLHGWPDVDPGADESQRVALAVAKRLSCEEPGSGPGGLLFAAAVAMVAVMLSALVGFGLDPWARTNSQYLWAAPLAFSAAVAPLTLAILQSEQQAKE